MKKTKYYLVNNPFGDSGVTSIQDDEELQGWLEDGSLEDGDIIIQAIEVYKVTKNKPELKLISLL